MTATLAEALAQRSRAEVLEDLFEALSEARVDANSFGTFSVERLLPEIQAAAQADYERLRVDVVKGGHLDLAATLSDPSWLRQLAQSVFQVTWLPAAKAVHMFRLTNTRTAGPYDFKPRQLVATTSDKITFRNSGTGRLLAGIGQTLDLEFTAETAGILGNIGTGQIQKLLTPIPGVTVANLASSLLTAGKDDEANSLLVARCYGRWGTTGKGGLAAAYTYNAVNAAPSITRVFIRDDNPFGPGTSAIYLANASGPATPTEVALVAADFAGRKVLGVPPVVVDAAAAHVEQVTATLYLDGSNGSALDDAEQALDLLASRFDGTLLYRELVRTVLMGSRRDELSLPGFRGVKNVVLTAPADDVVIATDEVLQFSSTLGVL